MPDIHALTTQYFPDSSFIKFPPTTLLFNFFRLFLNGSPQRVQYTYYCEYEYYPIGLAGLAGLEDMQASGPCEGLGGLAT